MEQKGKACWIPNNRSFFIPILIAWDDGKIRLFLPESGRLSLVVHDAHGMGVTAIAITADCQRIISGGGEGQVPVCGVAESN